MSTPATGPQTSTADEAAEVNPTKPKNPRWVAPVILALTAATGTQVAMLVSHHQDLTSSATMYSHDLFGDVVQARETRLEQFLDEAPGLRATWNKQAKARAAYLDAATASAQAGTSLEDVSCSLTRDSAVLPWDKVVFADLCESALFVERAEGLAQAVLFAVSQDGYQQRCVHLYGTDPKATAYDVVSRFHLVAGTVDGPDDRREETRQYARTVVEAMARVADTDEKGCSAALERAETAAKEAVSPDMAPEDPFALAP